MPLSRPCAARDFWKRPVFGSFALPGGRYGPQNPRACSVRVCRGVHTCRCCTPAVPLLHFFCAVAAVLVLLCRWVHAHGVSRLRGVHMACVVCRACMWRTHVDRMWCVRRAAVACGGAVHMVCMCCARVRVCLRASVRVSMCACVCVFRYLRSAPGSTWPRMRSHECAVHVPYMCRVCLRASVRMSVMRACVPSIEACA